MVPFKFKVKTHLLDMNREKGIKKPKTYLSGSSFKANQVDYNRINRAKVKNRLQKRMQVMRITQLMLTLNLKVGE
jgi:hypothetical protein